MKRLDTSPITSTNEFPVKSGTLDFLQDAYKEGLDNLFRSIVESPTVGSIYIVSGCKNSGTGSVYNITPGVLYLNGEFYNFDGASFTLTAGQFAYARIATTQYNINADPVTFTDGVARNVHNIRKIVVEATNISSGLPVFGSFIIPSKIRINKGSITGYDPAGTVTGFSGDVLSYSISGGIVTVTLKNSMLTNSFEVRATIFSPNTSNLVNDSKVGAFVYRTLSNNQFSFTMANLDASAKAITIIFETYPLTN